MSTASSPSEPRKLRILCLHGFTQNGPLFRSKTRALEKNLQKAFPAAPKPGHLPSYPGGVEFHYETGPIRLARADIPTFGNSSSDTSRAAMDGADTDDDAWAWWRRTDRPHGRILYSGLDTSLAALATTLKTKGPFDGVLGFSQGACAAILLVAVLEPGRTAKFEALHRADEASFVLPEALLDPTAAFDNGLVHPPLSFAVSYSGFRAPVGQGYDAFYESGLVTPSLHFLGTVDTVVSEERSLESLEACRNGIASGESRHRVAYHPGGHFVPASQKPAVNALVGFIREAVGEGGKAGAPSEDLVEDMDMPF